MKRSSYKTKIALLTLCLALATTIKTSKQTNAKQNNITNSQDRQDNATNGGTKLLGSHEIELEIYTKVRDIYCLTGAKYQTFLPRYIDNDPAKYLALLILAAYELITFPVKPIIDSHITSQSIYYTLFTNNLNLIGNQKIMTDENTNKLVKRITDTLQHIHQLELKQRLTRTDQILQLLLLPQHPLLEIEPKLRKLDSLISYYYDLADEANKYSPTGGGEPYLHILDLLYKVSQYLLEEASYQPPIGIKDRITTLGQLVQRFIKGYERDKQINKKRSNNKTNQEQTKSEAQSKNDTSATKKQKLIRTNKQGNSKEEAIKTMLQQLKENGQMLQAIISKLY